jgi:hypothetical protein
MLMATHFATLKPTPSQATRASLLSFNSATNMTELAAPTSISDYSTTRLTITLNFCL